MSFWPYCRRNQVRQDDRMLTPEVLIFSHFTILISQGLLGFFSNVSMACKFPNGGTDDEPSSMAGTDLWQT